MSLVDELIAQAEQLELSGHDSAAIDKWEQALAIERRPHVLARLGHLWNREGRLEDAERLLREAIAAAPTYADAYFYLGFNQKQRDQLDAARASLEKALQLEEWAPGLIALGDVYRRLDLTELARQSLERATELDPNDSEAWYNLGAMLRFVNRQESIAFLRRSISADPNNASALRELGHMLWREGELDSAEELIRRALLLNDADPWGHDYLGTLLLWTEREHEAETEFRKAIAIWPDVPLFYCNLGDAVARQNRMSEAENYYKRALSLDVGSALANLRMGQLHKERLQFAKARMYLDRALASNPSDRRVSEALAALDALEEPPHKAQ